MNGGAPVGLDPKIATPGWTQTKSPVGAAFGLMHVAVRSSGGLACEPLSVTEYTPRSGFVIEPARALSPLQVVFGEWIVLKSGKS